MEKINEQFLDELRRRLISSLIFFGIFFVVGFGFSDKLLKLFLVLFHLEEVVVTVNSPFEVFDLSVAIGLLVGFLLCLPFGLWNVLAFLKPALKKRERKYLPLTVVTVFFLFFAGFALGLMVSKWVVGSFSRVLLGAGVNNYWNVALFSSQVLMTSFFLGLVFEFPMVLYFLVKYNVVEVATLKEKRKFFWAGGLIMMVLLPPTDIFSLVLMVMPLVLLFEITLLLISKKRR